MTEQEMNKVLEKYDYKGWFLMSGAVGEFHYDHVIGGMSKSMAKKLERKFNKMNKGWSFREFAAFSGRGLLTDRVEFAEREAGLYGRNR